MRNYNKTKRRWDEEILNEQSPREVCAMGEVPAVYGGREGFAERGSFWREVKKWIVMDWWIVREVMKLTRWLACVKVKQYAVWLASLF